MADAVSHLPFTKEARFRSYAILLEVCVGQSGAETGFSPKFWLSSMNIIPPMRHSHLQLHVVLTRKTNVRILRTINNALSEIGEHWVEKFFQFFSLKRCSLLPVVPDDE